MKLLIMCNVPLEYDSISLSKRNLTISYVTNTEDPQIVVIKLACTPL